jgi:Ca2+-binding RTX toxin-like protein
MLPERLENRRLLAVTASLVDHTLTVTGDAENNAVGISRNLDAGTIVVRSADITIFTAPYADVNVIHVALLSGNDRLEIAQNIEKPSTVSGGEGNDILNGGGGADLIEGGQGSDQLRGGGGPDALFGGDGEDILDGGAGPDAMSGGGGFDTATYAARNDMLRITLDNEPNDGGIATTEHPAEGDNVRADVEHVIGGRNNDFISAAPAGDVVPGRVVLDGGAGNDTMVGSSGGSGGAVSAVTRGRTFGATSDAVELATLPPVAATSILNGQDGNDLLTGGSHNDLLNGGGGNDAMRGLDGNDTFTGGAGADVMNGGGGIDLASYADSPASVVVTLDNQPNDGIPATPDHPGEGDNVMADIERLAGSRFADNLTGSEAPNTIGGGDGNDAINGRGGNDVLEGSGGDDEIHGGLGDDFISGGPGHDHLFGDAGNDRLNGRDGAADVLDGGEGDDTATRDEGLDTLISIEHIV